MAQTDQSVDHAVYAKGATPAVEQDPVSIDDEIQARARRIRRLSTGERLHAQAALQSRINTMEKNIERGYREWIPALEADRKVLELSQMGILD
jgi:hypothetical protein